MPEFLRYKDGSIIMVDASSKLIHLPVCPLARIGRNEVPEFTRKSQFYHRASEHFGLWFVEKSDIGQFIAIELRVDKEIESPPESRKQLKLFPLPEMDKTSRTNFVSEPWEIIAAARVLHLKLLSDSPKQPSL